MLVCDKNDIKLLEILHDHDCPVIFVSDNHGFKEYKYRHTLTGLEYTIPGFMISDVLKSHLDHYGVGNVENILKSALHFCFKNEAVLQKNEAEDEIVRKFF